MQLSSGTPSAPGHHVLFLLTSTSTRHAAEVGATT
jgi:hypothetical protein